MIHKIYNAMAIMPHTVKQFFEDSLEEVSSMAIQVAIGSGQRTKMARL